MKNLYIIRGVAGAGKTTFAKTLAQSLRCNYYEADQYFYDDNGVYNFDFNKLGEAHKQCQELVRYDMQYATENIVVSNTFTKESELAPYTEMAALYGYQVTYLIVENRHGNRSIHNVPDETISKMKERFSIIL